MLKFGTHLNEGVEADTSVGPLDLYRADRQLDHGHVSGSTRAYFDQGDDGAANWEGNRDGMGITIFQDGGTGDAANCEWNLQYPINVLGGNPMTRAPVFSLAFTHRRTPDQPQSGQVCALSTAVTAYRLSYDPATRVLDIRDSNVGNPIVTSGALTAEEDAKWLAELIPFVATWEENSGGEIWFDGRLVVADTSFATVTRNISHVTLGGPSDGKGDAGLSGQFGCFAIWNGYERMSAAQARQWSADPYGWTRPYYGFRRPRTVVCYEGVDSVPAVGHVGTDVIPAVVHEGLEVLAAVEHVGIESVPAVVHEGIEVVPAVTATVEVEVC
jgi:hypothetical protein